MTWAPGRTAVTELNRGRATTSKNPICGSHPRPSVPGAMDLLDCAYTTSSCATRRFGPPPNTIMAAANVSPALSAVETQYMQRHAGNPEGQMLGMASRHTSCRHGRVRFCAVMSTPGLAYWEVDCSQIQGRFK